MPQQNGQNSLRPDELPLGALRVNAQWRLEWVNALAGARLGLRPDQAGGTALASLLEAGEAGVEAIAKALAESDRTVARGVRLSGSDRPVDGAVGRTVDGGAVIVFMDAEQRAARDAELERLQKALAESEKARQKLGVLQEELGAAAEAPRIVGSSAKVLAMLEHIERVAPTPATVLIHGETGSGKELVAKAIHAASPRARKAMVSVNCASLPETLIESELFGHERGAFTGADRQRLGKFELADDGTLFLDEIAELSMAAQAKLLRVLQEGTFERVGGSVTIQVDVRLVAATHRELARQVERGRFREDLFYRLNVFRIDVPPLRERQEDIRALAEHFHEHHAKRMAKPVLPLSERSVRRLISYRWPGNVRELENTIERATLLAKGSELEVELPEAPTTPSGAPGSTKPGAARDTSGVPRDVLLDLSHDQLQRLQIMHALETRKYRVFGEGGAAEKLGLNPQTLLSRMDKLGIPRPRAMRRSLKKGSGEE